jgi:hypothetical protein
MEVSGALALKNRDPHDYFWYSRAAQTTEAKSSAAAMQIQKDILRTFPEHERFSLGENGQYPPHSLLRPLTAVLSAFCVRNPVAGYTQGLNFIVGTMMLYVSEEDAFWLLVALSELLELKARYHTLTGEEYRKSTKRSRAGSAAEAPEGGSAAAPSDSTCASSSANGRRPKQPRVAKPKASEEPVDPMTLPPPADDFPPWAPRDFFRFELVHRSHKPGSRARVGRIFTPHGVIETPAFVPVGTNAALKCLDERHARDAGVQLMFCNTYHLLVHPGPDVVSGAGGLHSWMQHEGPLITDSGGFQVFSLAEPNEDDAAGPEMKRKNKSRVANREGGAGGSSSLLSVSERGARFRSYHDGKEIELTPESSVEAQKALGADVIIPLVCDCH